MQYIAIDLKSFYASVECRERGLNPLTTNLVVADESRTEKTICLAVTPSLKAHGIPGRARLFEVVQKVRDVNAERRWKAPGHTFTGSSYDELELKAHPELELTYLTALPRMALYMEYSTRIYEIYLKYAAPEDIHVYSIDEVFIDASAYLGTNQMTAREFAGTIIHDILQTTGITATAGIGTNLYLCKIAMDIEAKHTPADKDGVRIAELDEASYREKLWTHRPLRDFWRVGRGYEKKLNEVGLFTMGDIARCSLGSTQDYYNEDLLYKLFGKNAELLIDHAWGWEPCSMQDIQSYQPATNSVSSGQVLQCPYHFEETRLVVKEMADALALDLVEKELVTDQMVLTIGYDIENVTKGQYRGPVVRDNYGRSIPKHAHGTGNLPELTSSTRRILQTVMELYDRITDKTLLVRRITLSANHLVSEEQALQEQTYQQLELFTDDTEQEEKEQSKEKDLQKALLEIKKRYGKNAILKGMNLQEGATMKDRNEQIGGHKA